MSSLTKDPAGATRNPLWAGAAQAVALASPRRVDPRTASGTLRWRLWRNRPRSGFRSLPPFTGLSPSGKGLVGRLLKVTHAMGLCNGGISGVLAGDLTKGLPWPLPPLPGSLSGPKTLVVVVTRVGEVGR